MLKERHVLHVGCVSLSRQLRCGIEDCSIIYKDSVVLICSILLFLSTVVYKLLKCYSVSEIGLLLCISNKGSSFTPYGVNNKTFTWTFRSGQVIHFCKSICNMGLKVHQVMFMYPVT